MEATRPTALWAIIPALLLLGLSGCDSSGDGKGAGGGGFDTTDPKNRPEPVRFSRGTETLSPEARSLLEKTASLTSDARPAGSDGATGSDRWGKFFDGSGFQSNQTAPVVGAGSMGGGQKITDKQIEQTMLAQGVRPDIVQTVLQESRAQGADPMLVFAVIKKESSFNPRVTSPKGAKGLMQLMPGTGRQMGVNPKNLYDVRSNVKAGVKYLKYVWDSFSQVSMEGLSLVNPFSRSDVKAAIAAYNAGPGAVEKYEGVPPFRETQDYVEKVLNYYQEFRQGL